MTSLPVADLRNEAVDHLLPHFTPGRFWSQSENMIVIEKGEGCYLFDTDGTQYLDGMAGLFCTNLGHGRTDLANAAAEQMNQLGFYQNWNFAHRPAINAASLIANVAPGDLSEVFFVSSGSEAVESVLKFARCYHLANGDTQRTRVIARHWAYHGTTLGALCLTGVPGIRDPFVDMLGIDVTHVPNTLGWETDPAAAGDIYQLTCVQAVEQAILDAGPETVSMVIAEPVQNGRGALVPPDGYWQELRRICDKYGALLVADEVINSFGRLGYWFGSERFGVVPDLITFAKGVTSAYQPLGGFVARKELVQKVWDSPLGSFHHGSTFGGHPVATAVACATIKALREESVLQNVLDNEDGIAKRLAALASAHRCVKDTRGGGYLHAVEFMANNQTGQDLTDDQAAELIAGGTLEKFVRDARILVRPDNRGASMLMISPPLIADEAVLDDLAARLDQVLDQVDAWANP